MRGSPFRGCVFRWVIVAGVFALVSGCTLGDKRTAHLLAPKSQLFYRANMFNKFLRWKAFRRAKMLVMPSQRADFMMQWERDRPHIRITGYSVRDVTELKKGKEALVLVVMQRHRLPSVSVKRIVEHQRWESKDGQWFFVGIKAGKTTKKTTSKPTNTTSRPSTTK